MEDDVVWIQERQSSGVCLLASRMDSRSLEVTEKANVLTQQLFSKVDLLLKEGKMQTMAVDGWFVGVEFEG